MNLSNNTSESPVSVLSPVLFSHTCVYLFSPLNSEHKFLPSPTLSVPILGTRPQWQCPVEEQSQELSCGSIIHLRQTAPANASNKVLQISSGAEGARYPEKAKKCLRVICSNARGSHYSAHSIRWSQNLHPSSTFCWFRLPRGGRRDQGFRLEPQRRLSSTLISLCVHDNQSYQVWIIRNN